MYKMIQLKHVQKIFAVHFVAKIAYQAHETVTSLKLVEKGLAKEDLAVAVLIDFPFQIVAGYVLACVLAYFTWRMVLLTLIR